MSAKPLSINGLLMPSDFPTEPFEAVHDALYANERGSDPLYQHFLGAWNAISYRYVAMVDYGDEFTALITKEGSALTSIERYQQERALFGFFSNGFSILEAYFYGLFSAGAFIAPKSFPLVTPKDHQSVTPTRTRDAYTTAFGGDPILSVIKAAFNDHAYREWREIRNILTHRSAPGRRFYVTIEGSENLPEEWKILNIPLDGSTTQTRRAKLSGLLTPLLKGVETFVRSQISKISSLNGG